MRIVQPTLLEIRLPFALSSMSDMKLIQIEHWNSNRVLACVCRPNSNQSPPASNTNFSLDCPLASLLRTLTERFLCVIQSKPSNTAMINLVSPLVNKAKYLAYTEDDMKACLLSWCMCTDPCMPLESIINAESRNIEIVFTTTSSQVRIV